MTRKVLNLLFVLGILCTYGVQAQTAVKGVVVDAVNGLGLPGVSVLVKGTSQGVVTDFDGNYSIEVLNPDGILQFSYVGFTSQEIIINGKSTINISLVEDVSQLDEVVITALGIKRKEKTLSYSQQDVGGEEISKTKESNFVNSLAGRTAGLEINQSASGAGGSSKIILRGNKSVFGVSTPLIVIDGVPMANNSAGGQENSVFDSRDGGDGLSQINPDDIENVSILKGANAAALYGSQGANGVILITTKSGTMGKLSGNISSGILFQKVMNLPHMQYRYGAVNDEGDESWSTQRGNYNSDFIDDFFDTGYQLTNTLTLSGGSEKSLSYLSYANTTSAGVTPENDYVRHNVTFKQTNQYLDNKLKVTSRVMLSSEKIKNQPSSGYYFNPLTGLYLFPRNKDFNSFANNYEVYDEGRNLMLQNWFVDSDKQQNPYWIINNNRSENHKKRLIANVAAEYDLNDKMKFQVRGNYDYARSDWEQKIKAGTAGTLSHKNGRYRLNDLTSTKMYTDGIFTYNDKFGEIDLGFIFGGSYEKSEFGKGLRADSDNYGLQYANIFSLQNFSKDALIEQAVDSRMEKQSLFSNVQLGYKDMLFLDVSGRNDWSSTLAFTESKSYFYPAFGATALLSEMFELPEPIVFAKVRASYSIVSNEVPAFFTRPLNKIDANGIVINTEKPFAELKPEDQNSLEIGTDWRFLKNRLGLDVTYYRIDNKNQFLALNAPSGSGFSVYYVNAGHIRNSGVEVSLTGTPIKNDDLRWDTTFNFSTNKNEILELHPELQGRYEISRSDGYALYITEGGSFGDIYTYKFEKDEAGRLKVNANGAPQRTSEYEKIGSSQPDFLLGWNNNLTYKNWNLSFLINGKFGGKAVSATEALLDSYGVSERSALARDNGQVSINGVDPSGNAVSSVNPETYYKSVGGRDGIMENYAYNATNIRLKQVALSYDFDFKDASFFSRASISLLANNLFFIYKDAPFDPDLAFNTGNSFQSFDLFNLPSTGSYGLNLNLKF